MYSWERAGVRVGFRGLPERLAREMHPHPSPLPEYRERGQAALRARRAQLAAPAPHPALSPRSTGGRGSILPRRQRVLGRVLIVELVLYDRLLRQSLTLRRLAHRVEC